MNGTMKRTRHIATSMAWAAGMSLAFGCGSPDAPPHAPSDYVPPEDAGHADTAPPPPVEGGADRAVDGPVGDGSSTSFGDLVIVDIADTPCIPATAAAVLLSDAASTASGFEKMGQIGDRRFAFGAAGSVAVTFNYDGSSPSAPILGPLAASAQNGAFESLIANGSELGLQYYTAAGAPDGSLVALSGSMISGPSVGAGPTTTLAAWCTPEDVTGSIVDQHRMLGPMLTLFPGAAGDGACRTATQWNGMNFTVMWTRRLHDGTTKTSIGYVDLDGTLSLGKALIESTGVHDLVDFARGSSGYVALFEEGQGSGNPVAIRLDPYGNVLPPGLRLRGSHEGFGVATFGSEFAVAAMMSDGRAAVRPFDANGNVLGPWVCVDDRAPDMPFAGRAAIGTDDQGYAIAARMSDGSNWYMRTDHLGSGVPGSD
jgi:hypothetical protein